MNIKIKIVFAAIFLLGTSQTFAAAYPAPPSSQSLIGEIQTGYASSGDTVVTVQKRYDVGYNAISNANPDLNMSGQFSSGTTLQIPTKHLLPNQPRVGIVVNLPEMRMYYYPGNGQVLTYPIGIGKVGKTIPITRTAITRKVKDPVWIPPDDIREYNLQQGIVLPSVFPAGPDNPLGPYAIYMRVPTYLIHSTIFPESVGKRASFGCIRMYESDIQDFFPSIRGGMPVAIINSPTKIGWQDDHLYMEAHDPLEELSDTSGATLPSTVHMISNMTNHHTLVDWQLVSYISDERDGMPHEIGVRIR